MTRKEFEDVVKEALQELPPQFRNALENVDVVIEDEPDLGAVVRLGLGAKGRLLGLYQGVPLKNRTHYYGMVMPDKITLYKLNIERASRERRTDLCGEIKHVVQHEIAHHFGISDSRLRDLDVY